MFCPKCGKPVGDVARFCHGCGYNLSQIAEKKESKQKAIVFIVLGIVALFGMVFFVDTVALDGVIFGVGESYSSFDDDDREGIDPSKEDKEEENVDKIDKLKKYLTKNGDLRTYRKNYSGDYEVYKISYDEEKGDISISCVDLVDVKEEEKFAQVIVPDDQLSLAIGKAGQNAKLAAKLTNWKIDIKSESQFREMIMAAQNGEEATEESAETEE